jgi:hypothetical protein
VDWWLFICVLFSDGRVDAQQTNDMNPLDSNLKRRFWHDSLDQ